MFGGFDVFIEGEFGGVEDNEIETGFGSFDGFFEGVGVIGVEVDGELEFVADAFEEGGGLASADEFAFAFGNADDDGDFEFAGGVGDGFEDYEFGEIKVAHGFVLGVDGLEGLAESWEWHWVVLSWMAIWLGMLMLGSGGMIQIC